MSKKAENNVQEEDKETSYEKAESEGVEIPLL